MELQIHSIHLKLAILVKRINVGDLMKCENCGAELEEDTQFCSNCGSTVKKNNKNNKDSLKNNISLGNFNFSLKSIIIIIVALIILIGVFSMLMGNGNDVTVNGISFHLPDGYNKVEEITLDEGVKGEGFSYSNDADHEFINIEVRDVDMKDINDLKINGFELVIENGINNANIKVYQKL